MASKKAYAVDIVEELRLAAAQLDGGQEERLAEAILASRRVFLAGAGRSGLMAKAFAMRLMHLGFDAYVVGETITPGISEGDVLIIGSGSGETRTLVAMAEKAKRLRASVAALTLAPDSPIGRLADLIVKLPGVSKEKSGDDRVTSQPMGSLFEQTLLIQFDAVILRLMEKLAQGTGAMFRQHANLE
ncbi:6-phospho 3-hexuloisomerase [Paenibacillus sp. MY03]|uniref:6-phospho-3-hexuloisomerase n=1 Tax=Paenibacillus sp. MY03 TaxID=302980 RepID=UPI000B56B75D|nr:6-phospho-3-hexuloisomerase [Paenibacillus sp. MY03]OUS76361.1 6-phospho 3-hexuloisomerase [Paenibacillus sp. MY03]